MLLALDRMINIVELPSEPYLPCTDVDVNTFFNDVIGVTKHINNRAINVTLWVAKDNAPYVLTKPLHPSQELRKQDEKGIIINIKVVLNFELEREILGFGEKMKVLSPRKLKSRIISRQYAMLELYQEEED